jgi:hypothetical protein
MKLGTLISLLFRLFCEGAPELGGPPLSPNQSFNACALAFITSLAVTTRRGWMSFLKEQGRGPDISAADDPRITHPDNAGLR